MRLPLVLFALAAAVRADVPPEAPLVLSVGTDRPPASYAVGKPAVFSVSATRGGLAVETDVEWTLRAADGLILRSGKERLLPGAALAVTNVPAAPGFFRLDATAIDESGTRLPAVSAVAGAGIAELPAVPEPDGFDAFWAEARAEAEAADLPAADVRPAAAWGAPGAEEAAARARGTSLLGYAAPLGGKAAPATGWISVPRGAAPGSLPAVIVFGPYFERGNGLPRLAEWAAARPDAIVVIPDVHGFSPGLSDAARLAAFDRVSNGGNGGAYGFRDEENKDSRTCYFRGIAVRDLVSLRLLRNLPAWNGRATVLGAGLGGFRALVLAAFGGDAVDGVAVRDPWPVDFGGAETFGRPRGWLPAWQPALGFFDAVNVASRVRVPCAVIGASLASRTAPPSGSALVFRALRGPKSIRWTQDENRDPSPGPAEGDAARAALDALRSARTDAAASGDAAGK